MRNAGKTAEELLIRNFMADLIYLTNFYMGEQNLPDTQAELIQNFLEKKQEFGAFLIQNILLIFD